MTLGTVYQAATQHEDVLSVRATVLSKRVWIAVLNVVAVCVAKRTDAGWAGWLGEASAEVGRVGALVQFGSAEARARLAAELGVAV